MRASWKLLTYLFMMSGCRIPAAGSTSDALSCCYEILTNGSAIYRLNQTLEPEKHLSWNKNEIPITDEVTKEVDSNIVVALGPDWIKLKKNYSDIAVQIQDVHINAIKKVHCTVQCESINHPSEGSALKSSLFLILFIIAISSMI